MDVKQFVSYLRVSTKAQADSGLGLDAQRQAVQTYLARIGGALVNEYIETESGAREVRPRLKLALEECRDRGACLVIARLDRLARNMLIIAQLMDARVEFVAADMPTASKLTIHLIAAIAEYERDLISVRTKESLAEYKRRGGVLGNPRLESARPLARIAKVEKAKNFALSIQPHLEMFENAGLKSPTEMAKKLNELRVATQRKTSWTATGVQNIQRRLAELKNHRTA